MCDLESHLGISDLELSLEMFLFMTPLLSVDMHGTTVSTIIV